MAFFLLCIVGFIMFLQPVSIYPSLQEYQPLRNSALAALGAYMFFGRKAERSFFSSYPNVFFLLFILMQTLSAASLWISGGIETLDAWKSLAIIYYLIINNCYDYRKIAQFSVAIILGVSYLSFFSIHNFILNYEPGMRAAGFGWYDNSNDLAMILVAVIPLCFLLMENSINILMRVIWVSVAGLFGFNILFTGSRNGLLGLLAAGGASILLSNGIKRGLKIFILMITVSAILLVGVAVVMNRQDLAGLSGDASSEDRLIQWRACLSMVKAHPLLGVGPGEAPSRMAEFGGVRGLAVHNTLVQIFAETGIPGGIFFFLFSLYPVYEAIRTLLLNGIRHARGGVAAYKYLTISLGSFWVCAVFSNRVEAYILYVLVALIVCARENCMKFT